MSVIPLRPLTAALPNGIALGPVAEGPTVDLWLSAQELADAQLPGIPKNKRKVNELAARDRWAFRCAPDGTELARSRKGRGGGLEYHVDLLPPSARAKVLERFSPTTDNASTAPTGEGSIWSWYEQQSDKTKLEATRRLTVINAVEAGAAAGLTRSAAVAGAAAHYSVSPSTLWNWISLADGVAPSDRLAHLAPRRVGGGKECEVDHTLWTELLSDYLRLEEPTWESCYYRAARKAKAAGIALPASRTLFRKMEREVDPLVRIKRRKGREAHKVTMPPQTRSVADLHALEIVNIDGHKWDVFVKWPGRDKPFRPIMVAIQDVYSRKILAWRIDESENAVTTRLVFADLFRDYGIPKTCILDNGRAFASKWITGGAKTRYRFKIRPDDPIGLLPALGVKPQFATPYHGQAKPIERAFRDLSDSVAKHPAFAGAYTGRHTQAQPENYASKAIDLDVFMGILRSEIAAHNAKEGRRTEMANGRSFDQVFAESYVSAPIGKATPEQLRMALLTAADNIRTHRKDGSIRVEGNIYFCDKLAEMPATPVVVRFDPDNLHSEIHVYSRDGRFIATAPVWEAAGFADMAAANRLKKVRKDWRKKTKVAEEAMDLLDATELAATMPIFTAPDVPAPTVVRPVRQRGNTAAALQPSHGTALKPELSVVKSPLNEPKKPSAIDRMVAAHAKAQLKIVD